jgi:hypothetical protein
MAAAACPSYGELLAALESEFCPVDRDGLDRALDELARPVLGLEAAPLEERACALGRHARRGGGPDSVPVGVGARERLRSRTGPRRTRHRARAASRRAGAPGAWRGCWAIHVRGEIAEVSVDLGADTRSAHPGPRGCLCAPQLAFVVLTSLAVAWQLAGNSARARHARVLSLALSRGGAA